MDQLNLNIFSVAVIVVAIWFLHRKWKKYTQRRIVRDLSEKYQHVLAKKRAQLLVEDDYGDLDPDKWINEAQSFFTKKIEPYLDENWGKHISGVRLARLLKVPL